jgi:hypothetical protein
VGHEAVAQGKVGSEVGAVEQDHGDERVGVLEPAGSGTQPADRSVVGLGDALVSFHSMVASIELR